MKSYLKVLSRNKLYIAIEAVGLAVSLAFVILIGSYVVQQYEVAHESPQWKHTFALRANEFLGLTYWDKEELEMNIPEVQAATHAAMLWQPIVRQGDQLLQCSDMEADVSRYCRTCTNARMIEMLAATAIGLFSTLASMATPCSVKAKGGVEVFLFDDITNCDIIFWTSSPVRRNIKSAGNRSMFLLTAWFNAPVETWYNLARSKSSITFCPRNSWIRFCTRINSSLISFKK